MPKRDAGQEPARAKATLALLDEASRLLDGWTCEASTECCRFADSGREPWLTAAEWELVHAAVRRSGRRLPEVKSSGACPFLDEVSGRCRVYAARPLGCRTFYCARAAGPGPFPRREIARFPGALEEISGGEKGRPLTSWLADARRTRR